MNKKQRIWFKTINWIVLILLFIAIMVIFALFDKDISKAIYYNGQLTAFHKTTGYRDVFNSIGYSILAIPIFFTVVMIFQKLLIMKRIKYNKTAYWVLVVALIVVCLFINFFRLITDSRETDWTERGMFFGTGVIYLGIMVYYQVWFWMNKREDKNFINNGFVVGIRALIYLVVILVVVNVMKPIFGRNRPYEYFGYNDEKFHHHVGQVGDRPFYYPFEINGHSRAERGNSFPSGHVIATMSLFAVTLIFWNKSGWKKWTANSLIGLLVLLVASSRVLSLAHFCSDTVMSMEIGTVTYLICNHIFTKYLKFDVPNIINA